MPSGCVNSFSAAACSTVCSAGASEHPCDSILMRNKCCAGFLKIIRYLWFRSPRGSREINLSEPASDSFLQQGQGTSSHSHRKHGPPQLTVEQQQISKPHPAAQFAARSARLALALACLACFCLGLSCEFYTGLSFLQKQEDQDHFLHVSPLGSPVTWTEL